ncbi:MAG: Ig-like domain-containing protein, partial [Clostridia bacterium]|nr:Ig-like domain-containing protein [Clostridia bacterium]
MLPTNATNKNVGWSSDDTSVATVDQSGKVTAKAAGTAKITVKTEDGSKTDVCTVTVKAAAPDVVHVTGVTLSSYSVTLDIDGKNRLTATVAPTNATNKNVSWSSDDTSVATVDQQGWVTAVGAGTANIKAIAEDGGLYAVCAVTVNASEEPDPEPEIYEVKFYSDGELVSTVQVEEGKSVTPPSGLKKEGHYLAGWGTSAASGANFDFTQGVTGNLSLYAKWQVVAEGISYTYAGNECAAFEWEDDNPDGATVEYKLSSATSFTAVDAALVRAAAEDGKARVDVVGLKGGAKYDFKITTSSGETLVVSEMTVSAYDRSGYAHFNATAGIGAYNNDGTPKSNAVIVYVTEATKNTVTAKIGGKTYTGLVSILQNAGTSTPLIVRVIGTVGAATWNKLEENGGKALTPDMVVGKNGKSLIDYYGI